MKIEKKRQIGYIVVFILWLLAILFFIRYLGRDNYEKASAEEWLGSFVDKDYDACDELVYDSYNRVIPPTSQANDITSESCKYIVDKAVDSIQEYKITDSKEGTITGEIVYTPYTPITDLNVFVDDIVKQYIDGEIDKLGVEKALEVRYIRILQEGLFVGTEEEQVYEFTFYEEGDYVYGVRDFITEFLNETGITSNFEYYTNTVQQEVESAIMDYN